METTIPNHILVIQSCAEIAIAIAIPIGCILFFIYFLRSYQKEPGHGKKELQTCEDKTNTLSLGEQDQKQPCPQPFDPNWVYDPYDGLSPRVRKSLQEWSKNYHDLNYPKTLRLVEGEVIDLVVVSTPKEDEKDGLDAKDTPNTELPLSLKHTENCLVLPFHV